MTASIVRRLATPLATAALAACSGGEGTGPSLNGGENPGGIVLLTQSVAPGAVMEALYAGKVDRDAQGCLRLDAENGAVVIWPHGSRLQGQHVRTAEGEKIGKIGGDFRMGGGFVPSGAFQNLSDADRALAQSRCPSASYWVVGDPVAGD